MHADFAPVNLASCTLDNPILAETSGRLDEDIERGLGNQWKLWEELTWRGGGGSGYKQFRSP